MDYYNAMIAERENNTVRARKPTHGKVQTVSGTGEATVTDIALLDEQRPARSRWSTSARGHAAQCRCG